MLDLFVAVWKNIIGNAIFASYNSSMNVLSLKGVSLLNTNSYNVFQTFLKNNLFLCSVQDNSVKLKVDTSWSEKLKYIN